MAVQQFDVGVIQGELKAFASKVMAKIALDIHANLVASSDQGGTPVDTGFARANWIPRIREPVTSPVGDRPKSGERFEGSSTIERALRGERVDVSEAEAGKQALASYSIDVGPIYVGNAAPYIERLNEGHSPQAEPGFVERAIVKALTEDIRQ